MKTIFATCSLILWGQLGFSVETSDPYGYAGYNKAFFKLNQFFVC